MGRLDGSFITVGRGVLLRRSQSSTRSHLVQELIGRRVKEARGDERLWPAVTAAATVVEAEQDLLCDYLMLEPAITAPLKFIWTKEMRGTIRVFVWNWQMQQRCLYRSQRLHWAPH